MNDTGQGVKGSGLIRSWSMLSSRQFFGWEKTIQPMFQPLKVVGAKQDGLRYDDS